MVEPDPLGDLGDTRGEHLPPRGRELLGIVQPPDDGLARQADGAHRERPRDRAAADLVDADDDALTAELAHLPVHELHALMLRLLASQAPPGALHGLLHLLARVGDIALAQGGKLLQGRASQHRGDMCRRK